MLGRLVRRGQLRTVLAYILLALDTQDMALRDIALGKESMLHSFTSKNSDLASLLEDSDNDVSDSADSNHGNNIGKKPPKRTQKAASSQESERTVSSASTTFEPCALPAQKCFNCTNASSTVQLLWARKETRRRPRLVHQKQTQV